MKRYSEKRSDGNIWKQVIFKDDDVKITLNAWEYAEDYERETDFADFEYEGDTRSEEYTDILKALKTFVELIDKGWEIVELSIRPKKRQSDANFAVYIRNSYGRGILVTVSVNETEINKELAEKLKKIKEIIESA